MNKILQILLIGALFLGSSGVVHAQCDPTPYLVGVGLTDLNKNPVNSISANTEYYIKVCARSASVCARCGACSSGAGRRRR